MKGWWIDDHGRSAADGEVGALVLATGVREEEAVLGELPAWAGFHGIGAKKYVHCRYGVVVV